MSEYMGDFIFDTFQPFHFFENDDVDYYIPTLRDDTNKDLLNDAFLGKCFQVNK
jgi:hypothetical protein